MRVRSHPKTRICKSLAVAAALFVGTPALAPAAVIETSQTVLSPAGATGWLSTQRLFAAPFSGVIGFGVADRFDTDFHTLLLVDALTFNGTPFSGLETGDPSPQSLLGPAAVASSFTTNTTYLPASGSQMLTLSTGGNGDAYSFNGNALLWSNGYTEGSLAEWSVNWMEPTTLGFQFLYETFEYGDEWNDTAFLYWDSTPGDGVWEGIHTLAAPQMPVLTNPVPVPPAAALLASGLIGLVAVARRSTRYTL